MSLLIPELGAMPSLTWENPLIQYIYTKWSIADPAKPLTFPSNDKISFRVGFFDYFRAYEVNVLQTDTVPAWWDSGRHRVFLTTTMEVHMRMERLDRDAISVDPQLAMMEFEIMRIAMQYKKSPQDILGIKDLVYTGTSRNYDATDDHASTDWRTIIRLNLQYEIQNMQS